MTSDSNASNVSGVLRDLRNAVTQLFGGGKLPKEQEVPVEVLFALAGYVAKADSIVTSHEAEFVNGLMDAMDLPTGGLELASAAFQRGMHRQIDLLQEIDRIKQIHPTGSTALLQWLDTLIQVALADGRLFPRERETLEVIADAMGFSAETLRLRLAELGARTP